MKEPAGKTMFKWAKKRIKDQDLLPGEKEKLQAVIQGYKRRLT